MNDGTSQAISGLFQENGDAIPLEGVDVQGDIAGRGARIQMRQRFRNIEEKPIEAVYKFPMPESAVICGFSAIVDDRIIEGQIEERDKAFELYDKALSEGHGAQLLDEERPNIFTLSVGNIKPKSIVVIEINYVMLMDTHGPEIRFCLPTTISPRYTPDKQPDHNGIPVVDIVNPPFAPLVPYGIKMAINIHNIKGIASIGSASHSINTEFVDDKAVVSFASETVAMDRDFILTVVYKQAFANRGFVFDDHDASYIQIDLMPDKEGDSDNGHGIAKHREIVFVLDCSGSMQGSSITEAKKALEIMIKALNPGTLFNIYVFGSNYKSLFRHSKTYDEKKMKAALEYISDIDADFGGTEVLAPLKDIYNGKLKGSQHRDIILITDGEIGDEIFVMDLAKRHADKTALHTVGIGNGPNEFLIKGLARSSGGASELIAPNERIEPKILRIFQKVVNGRIRDIKIDWGMDVEQSPADVVAFVGQGTSIFARSTGKAEEKIIRITGETRSGSKAWDVQLDPVNKDIPIPILWAREKIRDIEEGNLEAVGSRQSERTDKKNSQTIIDISRKYRIVSSKTSYVGIEKRSAHHKSTDEIALRKVPAMLTKDWGGFNSVASKRNAYIPGKIMYSINSAPSRAQYSVERMPDIQEGNPPYKRKQILDFPIPTFLRRSVAAPPAPIKQDFLLELLSLQRANGGFDVDESLLKDAKLSDVFGIAEKIDIQKDGDKAGILMTVVILILLETQFWARRDEWESVVCKSRAWLQTEIEKTRPTIENQPLEQWVRNYMASKNDDVR
jgi:Ca-activated chloride channel family protein